ncbi:LON peptidase substrate-binding domain-containing protein [Limnochorda pilosa]|uniref:Peptidase S16 n=1 Tax=Limnochorda pilosa TaxID=1555112 RepID=A0A0K2SPS6_LIMPI|nr:LON peptidase substrate-binding domain-containing protein [Limnochorda pilosa]BAS28829.1 peptidase S16 [Limnochorda pilosa]
MEGADALLPLFPLHRVLFPGGLLTLRVFEPRYRTMLDDLRAEKGPDRFGVVLIERGREVGAVPDVHQTGTVARIERRSLDDGAVRLSLRGETRFALAGLEPGKPYPRGWVRYLPEPDGDPDGCSDLQVQVQAAFRAYLRHVQPTARRRVTSDEPRHLSYVVAQTLHVPLFEKQQLLEASTTQARLELEREILRRERRFLLHFGQGSSNGRWGPFAIN